MDETRAQSNDVSGPWGTDSVEEGDKVSGMGGEKGVQGE